MEQHGEEFLDFIENLTIDAENAQEGGAELMHELPDRSWSSEPSCSFDDDDGESSPEEDPCPGEAAQGLSEEDSPRAFAGVEEGPQDSDHGAPSDGGDDFLITGVSRAASAGAVAEEEDEVVLVGSFSAPRPPPPPPSAARKPLRQVRSSQVRSSTSLKTCQVRFQGTPRALFVPRTGTSQTGSFLMGANPCCVRRPPNSATSWSAWPL